MEKRLPHPRPLSGASYSAVELMPENDRVVLLDQRRLPAEECYFFASRVEEMAEAIRSLAVRGAPAIGLAAAYGMVLAAAQAVDEGATSFEAHLEKAGALLRSTRPTAINLAWAVGVLLAHGKAVASQPGRDRWHSLAELARRLHREDVEACRRMGALGARRVPSSATILTHCNAGALAAGGYGMALGVVRAAREAGKNVEVYASETRPVLQGARLTAWELAQDGIPVRIITDNMVAQLMARGKVTQVIVGADRIARSGDVANKIGTYGVACLAHLHQVPFDVAAPWSSVDLECPDGSAIPIEERHVDEVLSFPTPSGSVRVAPRGVLADNPSFDVTPARLVRAIYTERGEISPVGPAGLEALAPR